MLSPLPFGRLYLADAFFGGGTRRMHRHMRPARLLVDYSDLPPAVRGAIRPPKKTYQPTLVDPAGDSISAACEADLVN